MSTELFLATGMRLVCAVSEPWGEGETRVQAYDLHPLEIQVLDENPTDWALETYTAELCKLRGYRIRHGETLQTRLEQVDRDILESPARLARF